MSVFSLSLEVTKLLLTKFVQSFKVPQNEVSKAIEILLKHMIIRSGDSNPRIRSSAINCILDICGNKEFYCAKEVCCLTFNHFDSNLDSIKAEGLSLLVEKLIERFFIATNSWFPVPEAVSYCINALQHEDQGVRQTAENIILTLYAQAGDSLLQFLPASLEDFPTLLQNSERKPFSHQSQVVLGPVHKDPPPLPRMPAEVKENSDEFDSYCIFCKQYNPSFARIGMDIHYWQDCPMLTSCEHCGVIVEVSSLNEHLLGECEYRSEQHQCPRCFQAISSDALAQHVQAKECLVAQPEYLASRCPLCHQDISPWEEGWRMHLMGLPGCSANPRKNRQGLSLHRTQKSGGTTGTSSRARQVGSQIVLPAAFHLQPLRGQSPSAAKTIPTQRISR